jgi:hypothetical protein
MNHWGWLALASVVVFTIGLVTVRDNGVTLRPALAADVSRGATGTTAEGRLHHDRPYTAGLPCTSHRVARQRAVRRMHIGTCRKVM